MDRPPVPGGPVLVVGQLGRAAVDREHLAVLAQHAHRGHARPRQSDDQVGPVGEGRAVAQLIDCW